MRLSIILLFVSFINTIGFASSFNSISLDTDESSVLTQTLSLGLPVVEIITVDGEEPTADMVAPPEGSIGQGITNATKVPGSVTVYSPDGNIIYSSGEYIKKESGMTIKVRGNTSAQGTKKPYKIKLQKKGDMLGRGDNRFNDKNWVLIFGYSLKTHIGRHVGLFTGQEWMPEGFHINLIFNGDYRGMYVLQESIERNVSCRINVSDDGFIMEHDPYWWNEDGKYLESQDSPVFNYTFKYPEFEDATDSYIKAIHGSLKKYELSVDEGTYPDVIDVMSFAKWVLCHDILGTSDGGGVNWYLTKESISDPSPICCGPLWDFDSSENNIGIFSSVHLSRFDKLFRNKNNTFRKAYVKCWQDIRENLVNGLDSLISDLKTSNWDQYDISYNEDHKRWGHSEIAHASDQAADRISKWYTDRIIWLDKEIAKMQEEINKEESEVVPIIDSKSISITGSNLIANKDVPNLDILTIEGKIIYTGSLKAGDSLTLPIGIYIVHLNNEYIKYLIN